MITFKILLPHFTIAIAGVYFLDMEMVVLLFQKTYSLPNGVKPIAIGVGDFNNDNKSDIVVANYLF